MTAQKNVKDVIKELLITVEDEDVAKDFVESPQEDLVEYNDSIFDMEY